jgi:hypothetical protein
LRAASKPVGISTASRICFSEIKFLKFVADSMTLNLGSALSAATTPGESAPPKITIVVASSWAFLTTLDMTVPPTKKMTGISNVGITIIEISVRRSRSESFSSLR